MSERTHWTYSEKRNIPTMKLPDKIETHGKKMTKSMTTDKRTFDDDKTEAVIAFMTEAVIAFMNPKSKYPRPSRLRRQEKRRQQMESVKTKSPAKIIPKLPAKPPPASPPAPPVTK